MTSFQRIGVLAHPTRPQTAPIAQQIEQSLQARGIQTWLYTQWTPEDVIKDLDGTDMVVAIGGDGAMLRAARVCAPFAIPVLGLNMGHLGFLTEVQSPNDWEGAINTILAGGHWVEARMMLALTVLRGETVIAMGEALNEAVIGRGSVTRVIWLDAYINGGWTTRYNADGLIIATATGSTAYALAAGGPILPPELRNILLVPVAPHLSLDRPIVLPEGSTVEVIVSPESQSSDTVLAVDGEMLTDLQPSDRVSIQTSQNVSRFIRLRERMYFYRSLLDRMEPRISIPHIPAPLHL